ncbi:acetyl-CoA synthetase-like protein [Microthyrium microscopicum]|uniref:Acetyl-CoA synthetase-like protein n=1 Tax=Microthyrium microscopicum TaxID=703497 RepID=A0A6A6UEH8_9PEZI|nr:acetyl-CoA synthetase-like protein [Microthyrium microscopicum]
MPIIDTTKDLNCLFNLQVQASPDAIALEDETTILTYAQLDVKVTSLATHLRTFGVGRDSLVGVLLSRSADYVIACLAALRAGGAFLVLELAYPPSLLADVIDDAKPAVIVTHTAHASQITSTTPLIVLQDHVSGLDWFPPNNEPHNSSALPADDDLDRLAFASYSSGTTGRPKGIANPHRAAVLSYDLRFGVNDLGPGDRVACNVFFVWEILRPLLRGATVVVVPDETSYDTIALVELLSSRRVTETLMTPTLLAAVLARHPDIGNLLPDLRTLWFNGEVVTTDLVRRAMKSLPKARLLNCYSASETHEIACGDIRDMLDTSVPYCPVGPPLDPKHAYILSDEGKRVADGVSGELFVGGPLLARGYINLPETTAAAFLPDPFDTSPGARMYRTGDTGRILPTGILEITGRVGSMIKIRGYSVVPGKIERAIVEHFAVSNCVVIAVGDGLDRQLVAYIVHDKQEQDERTQLEIDDTGFSPIARGVLTSSLAQYMIPAFWVPMDELPTHEVSGKVDLNRLPSPTSTKSRSATMQNGKGLQRDTNVNTKTIAELWAASLSLSANSIISKTDPNFFDLGGHSLLLANLASRMTTYFGFSVPLARLAGMPTLEGHLQVVISARDGHTSSVQANLPAILKADSVLPAEFKPVQAAFCPIRKAETIFLTGATGFLGGVLLQELLEATQARIICLVRFTDPSEGGSAPGMARIRRNLLDLGLWKDWMPNRIEILGGNLSLKRMGLSATDFEKISKRIHVIIHAGATVNLVYPYAALKAANVDGTKEILRLACAGGSTLQYVSTNSVLPPSTEGWSEDTAIDIATVSDKLIDGYSQTKWVAEELIHEAARRGLPVGILRPGTISGHSSSGTTNTYDLLNAIIVESLHIGHHPDIPGWKAEMTPVDFVCKAIVTLADQQQSSQHIYHLSEPHPIEMAALFAILNGMGYGTKPLAWDEWIDLWNDSRGSIKGGEGAFTVDIIRGGVPTAEFLRCITLLNDTGTIAALGTLQRPGVDEALLETYTRHWYARGWLPRPPPPRHGFCEGTKLTTRGPLYGRVAVVTGASSGIGAAVATALAKEGVHVALASRRVEVLNDLKKRLLGHGNKIVAHGTDVTDPKQVNSLMETTTEQLGPIDILVSCAGVMYYTMMANVKSWEWNQTVDVNCKGLLHCLASTVPSMLSRGSGHIVAISSDAGRKVFPGLGVYSASKFFVEGTLQALRLETAGTGLRVTSVQPGNTATDLLSMSTDEEAIKKYAQPTGAKVLDPEDVASSIIYALQQPQHVAINEVLIEPRDEPI